MSTKWLTLTFLGNYCYQCADSKTDGSCQTSLKTMARASYYIKNPPTSDDDTYEKKKDLYNLFVKNCTAYQQNLNYTLCVIETFEYRGKRRVYLFICATSCPFATSRIFLTSCVFPSSTRGAHQVAIASSFNIIWLGNSFNLTAF